MSKLYIGIDNGATGTIGFIHDDDYIKFCKTPVFETLSYTKKKQYIRRLCVAEFNDLILTAISENRMANCIAILERPLVNPKMFTSTLSAIRIFEAQLIALENLSIPYMFIDSKQWQRDMLPSGIKSSAELKKASMDVGLRLFPTYSKLINSHKDADGILIAEWARRKNM